MKILQIIFASLLFGFVAVNFVYAQDKSKKSKAKDKEPLLTSVEVKANLMVLEADENFADIKLEDVKIYEDGVEQKITSFEKKANQVNVGLVIDTTGSMRPQLNIVKATAVTFANNIKPQDEFFITRFVNSEKVEVLQDWTTQKPLLNSALKDLYVEGGQSAVIDAIYLAAEKFKKERADKTERNAIILISDGEDRDSFYTQKELFDLLKTIDVQVFVIGLIQDLGGDKTDILSSKSPKTAAENFINLLALKTGGATYIIEGKGKNLENALVQSLKSILNELNSQYVVGYTSTNQKLDNSTRKLTVQIADGAKRQAFIRDGFVVPEIKN